MAGIYLHIPFCKQACIYCNFHFSTSLQQKEKVLAAMLIELKQNSNYLDSNNIDTIYFGGGTPSLLTTDEISLLIDTIYRYYNISDLKECTLEANPDDLNKAYIKSLRNTAINRLSIGVQSFRDEDLYFMKRAHNASQADYSIKASQDAGLSLLSIDLIYGIPGLSNKAWQQNIAKMHTLNIPHFSAYSLTVEKNTSLFHSINKKKTTNIDADQATEQFEILMHECVQLGYEQYEISNFALPGKHAIHNTNYWLGIPYLGIGPAAHSYNGNTRRWNIANNTIYASSITENNKIKAYEEETLTIYQQLNEYLMTSLRTMWGCDLNYIDKKWGIDIANNINKSSISFINRGQMLAENNILKLTTKGKLFADTIASDMFIL